METWQRINQERRQRKRQKQEKQLEKNLKKNRKLELAENAEELSNETEPCGRGYTVSIALPASILDNRQSAELRTALVGQIGRAASVFSVDEIVILDDARSAGSGQSSRTASFFLKLLQYMETPQYIRKKLFGRDADLRCVGLLHPLDAPHHLRQTERSWFREGVTLPRPDSHPSGSSASAAVLKGSLVDVGLEMNCRVDRLIHPGVRVTVKLNALQTPSKKLTGVVVSPSAPRLRRGTYWGFTVRIAPTLSDVLRDRGQGGYSLIIGTSDKGVVFDPSRQSFSTAGNRLVVFGGLGGLEEAVACDPLLKGKTPGDVFHHYLNTCPGQGSRTIRTEEAVLISLAVLRPFLHP